MREIPISNIGHPLVDRVGTGPDGAALVAHREPSPGHPPEPAAHEPPGPSGRTRPSGGAGDRRALLPDPGLRHRLAGRRRSLGRAGSPRRTPGRVHRPGPGRRRGRLAAAPRARLRQTSQWTTCAPSGSRPCRSPPSCRSGTRPDPPPCSAEPLAGLAEAALGLPAAGLGTERAARRGLGPGRPDRRCFATRMPDETAVFAGAPGLAATLSAQRTRFGIEEVTHAHLGLARPSEAEFTAVRDRLDDVAAPSRRHRDAAGRPAADPTRAARPAGAPVPAAAPGAAQPAHRRAGGPHLRPRPRRDAGAFRCRGRRPTPGARSAVPARHRSSRRPWMRLDAILGALDRDQLDEALGLAGPKIDAERSDGGRRAQP